MSDWIWTRPFGAAREWKTTKVTEMTGDQLATAERQGVLPAMAMLLFVSALVGLILLLIHVS